VQTSVVFGDPAAEIPIVAECFAADLVVVTDEPRWSVRALLAGLAGQRTFGTPSHARILHMPA
jgi:nucleotide-binding universal stress UspA family protein